MIAASFFNSGCATKRQIAVDYPITKASSLAPVKGYEAIDGDDYYIQLVSEFDLQGDSALKGGCSEVGNNYASGNLSAALVFNVHNDALKLSRDVSGFLYEATTGKCNFHMDTKKALLTPWMRLDNGKDTSVDYHFFTSTSSEANFDKLINDINAASGVLALTGMGTGVAIMGNIASQWAAKSANNNPSNATATSKPAPETKYSDESHTLPQLIELSDKTATLNQSSMAVHEVVEGGNSLSSTEAKALGRLNIYPIVTTSLLLKGSKSGAPDARDQSLTDLWQAPIKTVNGPITLQQLLSQVKTGDQSYLNPDWKNYAAVQNSCALLKRNLKELGFNKFDRNAVLYYFLQQSTDWRHYNIPLQRTQHDSLEPNQLKNYQTKNFDECLSAVDFQTMRRLNLPINQEQDWQQFFSSQQQQNNLYSSLHAVARQFLSIVKNPNSNEIAQQLYPLLATAKGGDGSVLLQNHLGSFGLEAVLQLSNLANAGDIISAEQLSKALAFLSIDKTSCVRPAPDQGKLLNTIGILLFTGKPNSPRMNGGALEFEIEAGKISRISLQLPSARDFEQHLIEQPTIGDCHIDPQFLLAPSISSTVVPATTDPSKPTQ